MMPFSESQWIWAGEKGQADLHTVNQYADFISFFQVTDSTDKLMLRISVDSAYTAYINGRLLYRTAYSDDPSHKTYDEIDITSYVRLGSNKLSIVGYCQNEDSSVYRKGSPGILFEVAGKVCLYCSSGRETLCRLSRTYESGAVEKFSPQLSYSFHYRADREDGWRELDTPLPVDFSSAVAVPARVRPVLRPIEPLLIGDAITGEVITQGIFADRLGMGYPCGERMQKAYLAYREKQTLSRENELFYAEEGDGVYLILDLKREESGYLYLDLELDSPALILIGFGEHLEDLRVRTSVGGRQFAVSYYGRRGRQTFSHLFKRIGARYLQLHFYGRRIRLYAAGIHPAVYPTTYKMDFSCENEVHNAIFRISRRTLELCMHEHYEDCPWREQALYAMDARNQMLCGYYAFEGYSFAQASLRLLSFGQRESGLLELCAPARVSVTIPSFSLCFITAVWENLQYSGDIVFAEEMYPVMEKILQYFISRRDGSGLIPAIKEEGIWNFYEWADGLDGSFALDDRGLCYESPLHFFLILALEHMRIISLSLHIADKALYYEEILKNLQKTVAVFWDEEKNAYASFYHAGQKQHFAELTQALALCCRIAPQGLARKLTERHNGLISSTLSSCLYKYEALMLEPDIYGTFVMEDIAKRWGKMLQKGATSFWETDKGASDFGGAGSLCHGWSAIPVYFYGRYVLGMQPDGTISPINCGIVTK